MNVCKCVFGIEAIVLHKWMVKHRIYPFFLYSVPKHGLLHLTLCLNRACYYVFTFCHVAMDPLRGRRRLKPKWANWRLKTQLFGKRAGPGHVCVVLLYLYRTTCGIMCHWHAVCYVCSVSTPHCPSVQQSSVTIASTELKLANICM